MLKVLQPADAGDLAELPRHRFTDQHLYAAARRARSSVRLCDFNRINAALAIRLDRAIVRGGV